MAEADYATDDESLTNALDDELRETISELAEARGQTSAGVVKAAVKELIDDNEERIIEFPNVAEARSYYRHHRTRELEFSGAYDELSPDEMYGTPAQSLHETLQYEEAKARAKARAAARYLDTHDSETKVVTNEYGSPEEIPQIDSTLKVQHGGDDE